MKEIDFKSIKNYSKLPQLLSEGTDKDKKFKTQKEILREFNDEKWAMVLDILARESSISLRDVDEIMCNFNETLPFYHSEKFYLGTGKNIFDSQLEVYEKTLRPYLKGASCMVEMGAGYGSKILNLSKKPGFDNVPIFAFEFTRNGCKSIKMLAERMSKVINVGACNFQDLSIDDVSFPTGGVVFTSYALHYIPLLTNGFIDFFLKFKPKVIVNFEPCYEHHPNTDYGLMCRRYIELNDYNLNIGSVLEHKSNSGTILLDIEKNIFGSNPFLPISILKWKSI